MSNDARVPRVRKYHRDSTEVSSCLKYLIFGFNVLFWVRIFVILVILAKGGGRRFLSVHKPLCTLQKFNEDVAL